MTARFRSLLALLTATALVFSEVSAARADTLWDLLRTADPARKRTAGATSIPLTPQQAVLAAQPHIDPKTGMPRTPADPGAPKKGRGGLFGFLDSMGSTFRRLGKQLNSDIKLSGRKNVGFHMESVSGNRESYENAYYFGRRSFGGGYDRTDLTISGKILGVLNFETHYNNDPYYNAYNNRVSLNYATREFKLDAGDIQGSITGNSLVDFSRALKGIQISTGVLRGLRLTGLFSETKAQTRTITINGANRSGPYYVYAGLIVDGSEKVRVNNRDMVKGVDYTLDPDTGELNFLNGLIIHEFDVIAVTYEVYGYNQSAGTLTGFRADLDVFRGVKMGLTRLDQTSRQGRQRTRTEQFYGFNNPQTPYTLEYPIEVTPIKDSQGKVIGVRPVYPMTVTVNAVPQEYDKDYFLDPILTNRVYFRLPIPATQIVKITYVPLGDLEVSGNRSVTGLDATFALGSIGNIVAEYATSRLDTGTGINGTAWQIRGDMNFAKKRLNWNWTLRNIDSNFTAIESPGFRRNERGWTSALNYMVSPTLRLTANLEKTRRPSYNYNSLYGGGSSGFAQAQGEDDFSMLNLGVNWQIGKGGQLSFQHNDMKTRLSNGGHSLFLTDNLLFSYNFGAFSFDTSLGSNVNESITYFNNTAGGGSGSSTTTSIYGSNSLTARLNMRWRASDRLSFASTFSNSQIRNRDGRANDALDMNVTAEIVPLPNMRLTLGYQIQDSGGYSSLLSGASTGTNNTQNSGETDNAGRRRHPAPISRQYIGGGYTGGYGTGYGSGYGTGYGGVGSYYGGGYSGGLGNYGNYSGGFYSGGFSGFSGASFGGKSRGVNVALSYQPWQTLNLDMNWNSSSSEGDYLFNSRRNDIGFRVGYNMGDRLSFDTSFTLQKVRYIGSAGGTDSRILFFHIHSVPLRRLNVDLNYSVVKTDSSFSTTGTGGTGTDIGNPYGGYGGYGSYFGTGGTDMTSYGISLEYPIWRNNNLFIRFDNSSSNGYLASDQRNLTFGVDFGITQNLRFSLGWRQQEFVSRDSASGGNFSYRVRSLDADLGFQF